MKTVLDETLLEQLWGRLGGPAEALGAIELTGPALGLPSVYEVSALASASVGLSLLAIAELDALRSGRKRRSVRVPRAMAETAFRLERELKAIGWQLPEVWDPIAGDYATEDGFIRLHTNYRHHREAVLRVLGVEPTREAVAQVVKRASAEALERDVVAAGGCGASLRSPEAWRAHPQGQALADAPLFELSTRAVDVPALPGAAPALPLDGIRVLDLTRVIAGPTCTRLLAGYGADVLRIDPPGFAEVGALLAETTAGKRRAFLDLKSEQGRARLEALIREAHVFVHGYRSDALAQLGFGSQRLQTLNPALIEVSECAYGFSGPWSARRGFDSIVQMSCGIAWRGREVSRAERPVPLPVQALDHATGYLMAAATCRSLTRVFGAGQASRVRLSLARTAKLLIDQGDAGDPSLSPQLDVGPWLERAETAFGPIVRPRLPDGIEGITPRFSRPAGPLGTDPARW
jgi:hypothetical protein